MSQNQLENMYEQKYLKYKAKYLELKNQVGKGNGNLVANKQNFVNPTSPFWSLEINVSDRSNNNKSVGVVTFDQAHIDGFISRPFEINFFPYSDYDIKTAAHEIAWPLIKDKYSAVELAAFNMRGLFGNNNNSGIRFGRRY